MARRRPPRPDDQAPPPGGARAPGHQVRIGVLLPRTGPTGLWALGCEAAALVAAAELNAAGGVDGAEVELVFADPGPTCATTVGAAGWLRDDQGVAAVVGMQASDRRGATRRRLGGAIPYIYTPQYEGGLCGPATIPIGITDGEVLGPGIEWFAEHRRARRFFFVGNDYVWPRVTHGTTNEALHAARALSVGEAMIPFGTADYTSVLDRIRRARPDVVIGALLGEETVRFNRAFAEAGLDRSILRFLLAIDETLLWAIGADAAVGLYTAQTYFDAHVAEVREPMLAHYDLGFRGSRPPVNVISLGCYDGVHVAAALARGRGDDRHAPAIPDGFDRTRALHMIGQPMPRGRPPIHLGEADGTAFHVHATV